MTTKRENSNLGSADSDSSSGSEPELQEGVDYYIENGLFVFTGEFLLKRGYCCESGCRHCPYPTEN